MTGQDIAMIQAGASTGAEYFQGQVTGNFLIFNLIVSIATNYFPSIFLLTEVSHSILQMFSFFRVPVLRYPSICGLRVRSGTGGSAKETLHFLLKIFGKRKQLTTQRSVCFKRNDVSRPNSGRPAQPHSQNESKSQLRPQGLSSSLPKRDPVNEVVRKPDSYDGSSC